MRLGLSTTLNEHHFQVVKINLKPSKLKKFRNTTWIMVESMTSILYRDSLSVRYDKIHVIGIKSD